MESTHYKKGLWTVEEDRILVEYISVHGKGRWNRVAKTTGLKRGGKSCRLRWMNYLSPSVKHGEFSDEEEDLIIRLHNLLGNRSHSPPIFQIEESNARLSSLGRARPNLHVYPAPRDKNNSKGASKLGVNGK